jgi:hypothetical protein
MDVHTRLIAVLALTATLAAGCDDGESEGESGGTETGSEEEAVGWFEVGWGEFEFEQQLVDGGELHIVWGSQGAAMFPMPVRGAEFELAPDPKDWSDERTPILDFELDVEGTEPALCGHFKCINNYPIAFDILPDGSYEFIYVAVVVSDRIDPTTLHGRPAHLWVQLDPHRSAPHEAEFDLTVNVDPPPF